MDPITAVHGADLTYLLSLLKSPNLLYKVSFWQAPDGSGVKVKVNGGVWTPLLGFHDNT